MRKFVGTRRNLMRDLTLKQEAIVMDHKSMAMANGENIVRTPDGERLEFRCRQLVQRKKDLGKEHLYSE